MPSSALVSSTRPTLAAPHSPLTTLLPLARTVVAAVAALARRAVVAAKATGRDLALLLHSVWVPCPSPPTATAHGPAMVQSHLPVSTGSQVVGSTLALPTAEGACGSAHGVCQFHGLLPLMPLAGDQQVSTVGLPLGLVPVATGTGTGLVSDRVSTTHTHASAVVRERRWAQGVRVAPDGHWALASGQRTMVDLTTHTPHSALLCGLCTATVRACTTSGTVTVPVAARSHHDVVAAAMMMMIITGACRDLCLRQCRCDAVGCVVGSVAPHAVAQGPRPCAWLWTAPVLCPSGVVAVMAASPALTSSLLVHLHHRHTWALSLVPCGIMITPRCHGVQVVVPRVTFAGGVGVHASGCGRWSCVLKLIVPSR